MARAASGPEPRATRRARRRTRGGRRSVGAPPRAELMTRARCGLCRRAHELLLDEAGDAEVVVTDVDTDPVLQDRYDVRVPVVLVDGVEVAELELAPGVVRDALRRARVARALGLADPAA